MASGKDDLLRRLKDPEDQFTERKIEGAGAKEFRKTLVAFANSVPEGMTALLYIGVSGRGAVEGVGNSDSLPKTIREICERVRYPAIGPRMKVVPVEGKQVLAVQIGHSENRPHFAGPAYVRIGSESVIASAASFEELIVSRNSKVREILKWKGHIVTVTRPLRAGAENCVLARLGRPRYECTIEGCTQHYVTWRHINDSRAESVPLEDITISRDEMKHRLQLNVTTSA